MPANINMSPAAPEDNQQDRIAKFEDLLPAAKLQQLNSVKDKFIADNRDDTARGFIEITNVTFFRQDDGKEVYVVETKEIDKENSIERERKEYYTIESQTATLVNIKQHTNEELAVMNAIDHDLTGKLKEKQEKLLDEEKSADKISLTDLEKVEKAGEELGIPKDEIDEEKSFEFKNDGVVFPADKMPSGTDSKEIQGNQLLDKRTTLNDLIGKNFKYYKIVKSISGQNLVIGINDDGSFEQIDSNTLEVIHEPKINLMAEKGQKVPDGVGVLVAFRVRQYPNKSFGIYTRGTEFGTYYAPDGSDEQTRTLGIKADSIKINTVTPNTRYLTELYDTQYEKVQEAAENPSNIDQEDILNTADSVNGISGMSQKEIQEIKQATNLSESNWNKVIEEVNRYCANNPNVDYTKKVIYEAAKTADDLDTKDRADLAKICKANGVEVPFNEFEPDVPQRGSNPNDHYSY